MHVESIQVGKPKVFRGSEPSAIFKSIVCGPIHLGKENLVGDQQADLTVHGGPDKAINAYPIEHYQYWNQHARFYLFKRLNLPTPFNGAFGENFTLSNLLESEVCIGDTFTLGEAIIQVSQPRQPCWKLAHKFKQPRLPFWMQQTSKTGWYFRVLSEGLVTAGDSLERIEHPYPEWSIKEANYLMYSKKKDHDKISRLITCEYLATSWKRTFEKFL